MATIRGNRRLNSRHHGSPHGPYKAEATGSSPVPPTSLRLGAGRREWHGRSRAQSSCDCPTDGETHRAAQDPRWAEQRS